MDKEYRIHAMESWPVSFRVIGIGEELSGVFRSIVSFGCYGVSIQSTTMFPNPTPTDEDMIVILLANGASQQLESIAKTFYQAGVLTLIVSSTAIDNLNGICDAVTLSHIESMPIVVKSLLEPILKQGKINYDFNDLYISLHNMEKFRTARIISHSEENRIADVVNNLTELWGNSTLSDTEFISLIFYQNKDANPPLAISEFPPLLEYIDSLPEKVTVIWALNYDENLQANEIRLDTIASGKNLKLSALA